MKRLSVITVNLNNAKGLQKTCESLLTQSFTDYEFIIIDGGSSDGSIKVHEQYSERITWWTSELDSGIYHAMNKGIRQATGEYCLFLNSGDWLAEPTILEKIFAQGFQADIIAGDIYFYDNEQQTIKWHVLSPDSLSAKTLFLGTLPHQATLIRRSLFDEVGLYNEKLKIASDWLFFVDALLVNGSTYQHHKGAVAYFNMDGISCAPGTNSLPRREQLAILQERYPLFLPDYERLDALEVEAKQWLESREYRVFSFLEHVGIIQLGVWVRRLKRALMRTFFRSNHL